MTDEQLTEAITLLRSPAYAGLSKTHEEYLEMLELEASARGLKI